MKKRQREHRRVRDLYLRGFGVIALLAFRSLERQLPGLIGEQGIAPASDRLAWSRQRHGRARPDLMPTLFWYVGASDRALVRTAKAGQLLGALLALGIAPAPCALGIGAIELSFMQVGDVFLGYQWESLLVESAAHAALVAPLLSLKRDRRRVSKIDVALMRALLSRLHLESGLVKWKARDNAWRGLEAMSSYYETAPLPNRVGWYAHHLPEPLQKLSTAAALGIECGAPFLGFVGRPARMSTFALLSGLQALIFATGNYGFFNLLTLVMNLWYLDDGQLPQRLRGKPATRPPSWIRRAVSLAAGAAITAVAIPPVLTLLEVEFRRPKWLSKLQEWLRPFEVGNSYGPFSLMTRIRPELTVEGTDDGVTWKAYRFRYKIDDVRKAPRQVAPHQPRLDWQMWFAALDPVPSWFLRFVERLLQGSAPVLALLAENPFPDAPPKQIRATLHHYRMATLEEHRQSGVWWTREDRGEVLPPISLRAFES